MKKCHPEMQHFIMFFCWSDLIGYNQCKLILKYIFICVSKKLNCFERFHTIFKNASGSCFAVRPEVRWRESWPTCGAPSMSAVETQTCYYGQHIHICSGGFCSFFSTYVRTGGLGSGSVQVDVPVLKFLAGVSSAQGGTVAPMTGTIERVILAQFL